MSLTVRAIARTDAGRVRDNNEDAFHLGERVFCVADGLGGHQAGEVASGIAATAIAELDARPVSDAVEHLGATVRRANRLVHDEAAKDSAKSGMGTTLTAAVIDDAAAHLAHVADSRCYLLRDGDLQLLTDDHTVVGRMVADGLLTEEQAAEHPQRSVLTRALGTGRNVDVDITHVPLRGGDRLLLCSDGLTAVIPPIELTRLTAGDDLDEIGDRLIATALERGAPDNVTIVLVEIDGTPSGAGRIATSDRARSRRTVPGATRKIAGIPRRMLVWTAVLAIVSAAAIIGVRSWVDGSYYVGFDESDRVAIFNGVPVEIPVLTKRELVEPTDISSERVPEFQRPELEQGVLKGSLEEARAYVETLRDQLLPAVEEPAGTTTRRSRRGS